MWLFESDEDVETSYHLQTLEDLDLSFPFFSRDLAHQSVLDHRSSVLPAPGIAVVRHPIDTGGR